MNKTIYHEAIRSQAVINKITICFSESSIYILSNYKHMEPAANTKEHDYYLVSVAFKHITYGPTNFL